MTDRPVRQIRTALGVRGDLVAEQAPAALAWGPDALRIDLEEPCTPCPDALRARMRIEVGEWLASQPTDDVRPRFAVRVQPVSSGQMLVDTEAILGPNLDIVWLPKVETAGDIVAADAILTNLERGAGLPVGRTLIWPILETAQALREAHHIAAASPRIAYIGGAVSKFGDIVQALGYRWTRRGRETAMFRSAALLDVRAAHSPWPITGNWGGDLDDLDGLRAWATSCRDLGYAGTLTTHGPHVAMLNEIFGADW